MPTTTPSSMSPYSLSREALGSLCWAAGVGMRCSDVAVLRGAAGVDGATQPGGRRNAFGRTDSLPTATGVAGVGLGASDSRMTWLPAKGRLFMVGADYARKRCVVQACGVCICCECLASCPLHAYD